MSEQMHCDKMHADIPVSTCIARQTKKGSLQTPPYPECVKCIQGNEIIKKYGKEHKGTRQDTIGLGTDIVVLPAPAAKTITDTSSPPLEQKYCPGPLCKTNRSIEDFGKSALSKDGRYYICKKCKRHLYHTKYKKQKSSAGAKASPKAKAKTRLNHPDINPGKTISISPSTQKIIASECEDIKNKLLEKNASYGDSAIDPVRIFSKADPIEQINVRIDDKLSRMIRGHEYPGDNDEMDLIGYLILKRVARRVHGGINDSGQTDAGIG